MISAPWLVSMAALLFVAAIVLGIL